MICTHLTSDDEDANRGGRPHDNTQGGFLTLNTHDQHLLAAGPCNDFTDFNYRLHWGESPHPPCTHRRSVRQLGWQWKRVRDRSISVGKSVVLTSVNSLKGGTSMTSKICRTVKRRCGGFSSACRGFGTDSGTAAFPGGGWPLWLMSRHIHHIHLVADLKMDYVLFPLRAETLVERDGSAFKINLSTKGNSINFSTTAPGITIILEYK